MKFNSSVLVLLYALNLVGISCQKLFVSEISKDSINPFGIQLYDGICGNSGNCVYSPFSLYTVLAMLATGAEGATFRELDDVLKLSPKIVINGTTFNQLADLLKVLTKSTDNYIMDIQNGLYVDQQFTIKDSFKNEIQNNFFANSKSLNFQGDPDGSRQSINQDVATATRQQIKELLPPGSVQTNTVLALTNAIYFKAGWALEFDKEDTSLRDFTLEDGQVIKVETMFVKGGFRSSTVSGVTMVEVPYAVNMHRTENIEVEEDVSMILLIPDSIDQLGSSNMGVILDEVLPLVSTTRKVAERQVDLYLPKFDFEFTIDSMKEQLMNLGLKRMFSPIEAELGGIAEGAEGLYISDSFHKAKITVTEEGREAAAASAVLVNFESVTFSEEIKVDRPFVFLIVNKAASTVTFIGRVNDPSLGMATKIGV
eukprot:TRINITY_DN2392_c0_g1_i13.p1 TRINITY_DN2392_c0_g1~~TRINITY_DN2392_c0_g1_i13.p1  ORF type:complete len:426 (-),score=42.69 TRINITY_DN2392_c0_g1_i13:422-1699(-)